MTARRWAVFFAALIAAMVFIVRTVTIGGEPRSTTATSGDQPFHGRSIEGFVGSASRPATDEAVDLFQRTTGARVTLHYGGSGSMLSQMKLTRRGDFYFPGSSDFMELAKREGLVRADTERIIVYLVPAINVPRGNPRNVRSLQDLTAEGVRVGIARPDTVCVGLYAVEILERAGLDEAVRPNIVTNAESCEKLAQLVSLGAVDAALGWEVFEHWDPEHVETIPLRPEEVSRIGYLPVAVSTFARDEELALAFIDFLRGPEGQAIYRRWHYLTTEEDARRYALPTTPVGGEWILPDGWK